MMMMVMMRVVQELLVRSLLIGRRKLNDMSFFQLFQYRLGSGKRTIGDFSSEQLLRDPMRMMMMMMNYAVGDSDDDDGDDDN